ncbi:MAG: serine/threonine protein kinase [Acidobacteriia bacterium]|nr:serine/threonine protein kinase [Terriglobia bacterium]
MIAPAGRKLGKYEIRQKLGRGGMADVYLAQDTQRNAQVALKIIEHSADPDIRESIDAERRGTVLQASLAAKDPRVVPIYDSGDLDGFFFVSMEYVDGQDLAELVRRGPLPPEFGVRVALEVAEALEHAHSLEVTIEGKNFRGIVHGDIKPKNIRIDSKGRVRVLDFGIAKALSLSRRLTRNEFGSVPYASPERLDTGEVNVLSDLWSLAVMLYEMVAGMQPYQADSTDRLERMIRSRIPPPPAPDPCPEQLRRILRKAMAPAPEARYQSAAEFAGALRAFRSGDRVVVSDEELDATRRTFPAGGGADDATLRTFPAAGGGVDDATRRGTKPLQTPAKWPPAKARPSVFGYAMRTVAVVALASIFYGLWSVVSEYFLWKHGQQFEREIQTEQITDPDQIWSRWTELSKGNPSSLLLYGVRKVVRQKFLEAANHVILTYRDNEGQPVYEKDWERARNMAARALAVDPDNAARGDLRLAEGHIDRINGTVHGSLPELKLAVEKFNEAQHLMPKSPDPELGLARVYIYGLRDPDRGYQAMQQARKLGFDLGNRERAQLADGYRSRADRLWWDSRNVRGLPQERDEIQHAEDDYKRALQLYQQIAPYGNSNDGIVKIEKSLESVDFRLNQLGSAQ